MVKHTEKKRDVRKEEWMSRSFQYPISACAFGLILH